MRTSHDSGRLMSAGYARENAPEEKERRGGRMRKASQCIAHSTPIWKNDNICSPSFFSPADSPAFLLADPRRQGRVLQGEQQHRLRGVLLPHRPLQQGRPFHRGRGRGHGHNGRSPRASIRQPSRTELRASHVIDRGSGRCVTGPGEGLKEVPSPCAPQP